MHRYQLQGHISKGLVAVVLSLLSLAIYAQQTETVGEDGTQTAAETDDGDGTDTYESLPRVSAAGAFGDAVTTGVAASSSTYKALAPPPGVSNAGGLSAGTGAGLSLGVSVGRSWHSNPERQDEKTNDAEASASIDFAPHIGYQGNLGRHQYELGYTAGFEQYDDISSLDVANHQFQAALKLNISKILVGDIYYSYTDGVEQLGSSGTRDNVSGGLDEYTEDVLGGRLTLGRRSNLLQLYVAADTGTLEYANNNQDSRDRDNDTIEAGLFFNIGPKTSLFVRAREYNVDYLIGKPSRDSTETSLTAGITWETTEVISLLLEAGNLEKKFDDPAITGYDDNTYLAKILWRPKDRTNLSLYASRRTEESAEQASAYYVSDLIGIDLTQQLGNRTSFTAYYTVADDEFPSGRQDEITDYGIAFDYSLARWISLGLSWNSIDRTSTDPTNEYEDEIFSIFANLSAGVGRN